MANALQSVIPGLSPTLATALGWTVFHTIVLFWPFVQAAPFLLPFAIPAAFGAGFAGLAGLAGIATAPGAPVLPAGAMPASPVAHPPMSAAPSVSTAGSIGTSSGHAPAVSSAPGPSSVTAAGGVPPGGGPGFAPPYAVGGASLASALSAQAKTHEPTSRGASKAPTAAAAVASGATDRIRTRRRQRARQHSHAYEFMDMNVDVEPEWTVPTAESDRGAGALGFSGTVVQGQRAGDRARDAVRRRVRWRSQHADVADNLGRRRKIAPTRQIPLTCIPSCSTTGRRIEFFRDRQSVPDVPRDVRP